MTTPGGSAWGQYKKGMTASKIEQLEKDIANRVQSAKWAWDLDPEFLKVLKNLGNAAIHPNDGDVSRQEALDPDLLVGIKETFCELLESAYEVEAQRQLRLDSLRDARRAMRAGSR